MPSAIAFGIEACSWLSIFASPRPGAKALVDQVHPSGWRTTGAASRGTCAGFRCFEQLAVVLALFNQGCSNSTWRARSTASCARLRSSTCWISETMRGYDGNGSSMWPRTKSVRLPTDFIDTVW